MVPVNDWTMTTRCSNQVFVTGLLDKRDTFSAINVHFEIGLIDHYTVDLVLYLTKKGTTAKRVGQTTPMSISDRTTIRTYCCTKPN